MPDETIRTMEQRRRDTLHRLEVEVDAWVATAGAEGGDPYLVPLSFWWDGQTLLFATPRASPTGRNVARSGRARVAVGPTRDVVLIEGSVDLVALGDVGAEVAEKFAAKTGFDPRDETPEYLYFLVRPLRIQAWREANELAGRLLMRDGRWVEV